MLALMTTENTESNFFDISPPKVNGTTGYSELKRLKVIWGRMASWSLRYRLGTTCKLRPIIVNA